MEAQALRSGAPAARRLGPPLRGFASDERLVDRVRDGDDRAFETLFDRYHRPILSFCRHMLGSAEEGEDAVQQSFLAAYRAIQRTTDRIQVRPWLYTIARNQCLTMLRARRDHDSIDDVEPSVAGLSAEVQQREDLRDMLRDMARLPAQQRAALVLAELGALSHDEVADVVGCPKGKVKALVFQARSSLAASRDAREAPCQEIREQLSTLSGGSLRRSLLSRHVRECPGCREFRDEVRRQRAAMALLLPVIPSAGLKGSVLSCLGAAHTGGGGAAAAAGVGGTAAAVGGGAAATGGGVAAWATAAGGAKVVAGAAIAALAVGSTWTVVKGADEPSASKSRAHSAPAHPRSPAGVRATGAGTPAAVGGFGRRVAGVEEVNGRPGAPTASAGPAAGHTAPATAGAGPTAGAPGVAGAGTGTATGTSQPTPTTHPRREIGHRRTARGEHRDGRHPGGGNGGGDHSAPSGDGRSGTAPSRGDAEHHGSGGGGSGDEGHGGGSNESSGRQSGGGGSSRGGDHQGD
jgi:RNA polymerase sigma factor (sigma-70 family)